MYVRVLNPRIQRTKGRLQRSTILLNNLDKIKVAGDKENVAFESRLISFGHSFSSKAKVATDKTIPNAQ